MALKSPRRLSGAEDQRPPMSACHPALKFGWSASLLARIVRIPAVSQSLQSTLSGSWGR
jgi:hypothetical protein